MKNIRNVCPVKRLEVNKKHINNKWTNDDTINSMKKRDENYKFAPVSKPKQLWKEYKQCHDIVVAKGDYYTTIKRN